ncbi:MAG: hypothetical protein AAF330_02120 [Pseudomonadota bacterium]
MRRIIALLALLSTPALAGGDAIVDQNFECLERRVERAQATIVVDRPTTRAWNFCMVYRPMIDGDSPGSVVITVRDPALPSNAPHIESATILGFMPSSESRQSESCVSLDIAQDHVLAAIQTSGKVEGRIVRACTPPQ